MMQSFYNRIVDLSNILFKIEKVLLMIAVFFVTSLNFINVCLRYLSSYSLNFCETLSVVLFMFIVLLGANLAVKTDNEIKIEIFKFNNPRYDAILKIVIDGITLFTIILCLNGLSDSILAVMKNKQRLTPLPLYTYHVYIVMLAGFALVIVDRFILFLKHILTLLGKSTDKGVALS